jgi:hypothetical protein
MSIYVISHSEQIEIAKHVASLDSWFFIQLLKKKTILKKMAVLDRPMASPGRNYVKLELRVSGYQPVISLDGC